VRDLPKRGRPKRGRMVPIMVYYPKQIVDMIDLLVANGFYTSRAQCIREITKEVILNEFREISEMYKDERS